MPTDVASQDSHRRTLQPLMPQPANSRPVSAGKARNNTQTGTPTLKARVNLSESLIGSPGSPFAPNGSGSPNTSTHSTPSGPSRAPSGSSVSPGSGSNLTPTDNAKRIRSPITKDTATFPSKYGSPTLQAPVPSNRPVARSGASPVPRSALSPEVTGANQSNGSNPSGAPKRAIKASISGNRLMPSANISPLAPTYNARAPSEASTSTGSSIRSFARSPSPARQPPSPKRPHAVVTRAATTGTAKTAPNSYLASPPLAQVREQSRPSLRPSASNPNLSRPARASVFQPTAEVVAARKNSTTSSSSGSQNAAALPSPGARTPKSPNPDLPPDVAGQLASVQSNQKRRVSAGTVPLASHEERPHSPGANGLGVSLHGVLDEEDLKEIERAKEREKEARENRKVLDLEITNASLLAINAMLERAKQKQSTEISSLRRKLREGPQFLPSPMPTSPGVSSSSSVGINGELLDDEEAEEEDWVSILNRDPEFGRIARCLESLVEEGQNAVKATAQEVQQKTGLKVVSRFNNDSDAEEGFEEGDSSFIDDSMLSLDPSPLRHRKSSMLGHPPRQGSRLRVSSLTSDGTHEAAATDSKDGLKPGTHLKVVTGDDSLVSDTSRNSDISEPEAWSRGISSPTSSAANTRVQSTPMPSIPASPSGPPASPKILPPDIALPQSPPPASHGSSSAMSTMAGFLGWNSPKTT